MSMGKAASIGDLVLGIWLLLSAVLLPHTRAEELNSAICGLLAIAFALVALTLRPAARLIDAALGVWIVLSAWVLPGVSAATAANSLLIGVLMFGISVVPPERTPPGLRGA